MRRLLLAAIVLMAYVPAVSAAEQTILGKLLLVKNKSTVDKRKIVLKAKEGTSPNTIVGNPVLNGATLTIRVYGDGGANSSVQTFALNAGNAANGKPFWREDGVQGFKYKDSDGANSPVKLLQIRKDDEGTFSIKAIVSGKLGTISVLPPDEGIGACATLELIGGDTYSLRFADGTVKNKGATQFKISNPITEGSCAPTCGNGFIDSGEQCDTNGLDCGASAPCQADCTCPCDFLDPAVCMFPFPSDFLTSEDPTTDTGRRVHFANAGMPKNSFMVPIESSDYNWNDGFSPGSAILLRVPNIDLAMTGAAPITDIEQSLDANAPIVVINADTLAKHLIWAELDANVPTEPERALHIRPAVNFAEATRYIVALRQLKDGTGAIIPPDATFLAYRDNTPTGDPVKEARRPHMEALFSTLTSAGIPRNDLYLAWDFTVASEKNISERLLFMRDDAFSRLGSDAPVFTITNVEDDLDSRIYRRVTGTYEVERYVNSTATGARFNLDANGLPTHQGTPQVAPFICNIPRAAMPDGVTAVTPGRASLYGHGLLGSNDQVNSGPVKDMSNEHNFIFCATNWIGMSAEDVPTAVNILQNFTLFPALTDRLQQSMVNQLFLARLMIHPQGFASHAAFQDAFATPVIDPSDVFFYGNSQGGIFGGTLMAVAQDITRGVLGVPGMNYSLLLYRSVDFDIYELIFSPSYPTKIERQLALSLIQMLWDRSDPNGYAHHMTTDPLPNTPQHKVLLHLAFGDHQVANLATEIQTRTIGASIHQPAIAPGRHSDVDPYFGIPAIPSYPFDGSALIIWDSGSPTPPTSNIPPTAGADPHSHPRSSVVARQQMSDFLTTGGAVTDVCVGIPCVP